MSHPAPFISIVSPVYNSSAIVAELVRRIEIAVSAITSQFEIILVDDGSTDHSWQAILDVQESTTRLVACKLEANVGQHYAIRAGLELAKGNWVVVMDCDLQDNPDNILPLFQQAQKVRQSILAHRLTKKNRLYYVLSSLILNKILSWTTACYFDYRTGNFGVFQLKDIQQLLRLPTKHFYFPVAIRHVCPGISSLEVLHDARFSGNSTYNFHKQWALAIRAIQYSISSRKSPLKSGNIYYSVESVIYAKFDQ